MDLIQESGSSIQLPQELINDILVRLPVKSLLRFKCVSKPWLSLISDPQFIRSHFSKSSSIDQVENLQILFTEAAEGRVKKCSLSDASTKVSAIEFPDHNMQCVIGIINGLVCLKLMGTDLCVWNPALKKIMHFNDHPKASYRVHYFYSFGYEESNDDYKVVCLQTVLGSGFDAEVRIYSLKAHSWRKIDQLKGFNLPFPGVFAHGKIYWSGLVFATHRWTIVSLDLSSEKFVELQHPGYNASPDPLNLTIGASGGRTFGFCHYYKGKKADLWVLDEHGVEESWSKLVSIPYAEIFKLCFDVLCVLSNGEIVFQSNSGLFVYD